MIQVKSPRSARWANRRQNSTQYVRWRLNFMVAELGKMYFVFSLIMRLPTSMLALSLLILMSTRTNEITLGGYGAGIIMLASSLMVPVYLKLSEATSKTVVLVLSAIMNIPAVTFLILEVLQHSDANVQTNTFFYFLATLVVGVTVSPFGALIRVHWSKFFNDTGNRQTFNSAIALESVMDIISIPVGALLTGLISYFSPEWSLISVIFVDVLGVFIILWLPQLLKRSPRRVLRPVPKPLEGTESLRWLPLFGISCLGLLLGSTESALASYTVATDTLRSVGFYLALLGLAGTIVGATLLFYRITLTSWKSWVMTGVFLIMITMLLSTFTTFWGLIVMLILLGAALGVGLICMDSIATAVTPRLTLGAALTSMQATYFGGVALGLVWGVALGGRISYQASLLVPLIGATLYFIFGHLFGFYWRKAFEEKLPQLD